MKTLLAFTALIVTISPLARAEDLLEKYFVASGGAAGLNRVRTRISEGSLEMPGGRAGFTLKQKAPNRAVLEFRLPRGVIRRGFDGSAGWEDSSVSGSRPMAAAAQTAFMQEHGLEAKAPEHVLARYPKREQLSPTQLRMTPAGGSPEVWTFDPATHLLTRIEREIDGGPQGRVAVIVILEDYKKVGDLILPHTIHSEAKMSKSTLRLDSIRDGESLTDDVFAPPSRP